MKGKFAKGKKGDEWYLIIEGSIDVLRGFLNVLKALEIKLKMLMMMLLSMIEIV